MIPAKLPVDKSFTYEEFMEASKIVEGFSGREIKGAILDLLLSKAEPNNNAIKFTIEDFYNIFNKKQEAKKSLRQKKNVV